ncbi:hypothetical protein SLE2022_072440 [Rubroshorea leprosula]|uniref:Protein LURP-one-related 14-like n=1 Tax=Rubroshorea leprosula TaxID=152421 RepID=A0AAV5HZK8_9ROSI|nr:hypothetical protein SLEP1_g5969 [Rubroshorea leprosula]
MAIQGLGGDDDPVISVVGDGFCLPYAAELVVKKKIQAFSNAHYDVYDTTGNILLKVDGGVWNLQKKRVMRDPADFPVLTMREKAFTWRHRWLIHQGEGSDRKNLLCTVRLSQALQIKRQLDVFLAGNQTKDCDFHVTGSLSSLSFKVYRGKTIIAEVIHSFTWESFCKGKESFTVRLQPEVDYAFIVALIVIIQENESR